MTEPPEPGTKVRALFDPEAVGIVEESSRGAVFVAWPKGGGMWLALDEIEATEDQ